MYSVEPFEQPPHRAGEKGADGLAPIRNLQDKHMYSIRLASRRFSSTCPFFGVPMEAELVIDYAPALWLVEIRSLQTYLDGWRKRDAFHENTTVTIGVRLVELLDPHWLRVGSRWKPNDGAPIEAVYQTGHPPKGIWVRDLVFDCEMN